MELRCAVQNYAWGKVGMTSAVAQLTSAQCKHVVIRPETPYAELWMGTHPSGPSIIVSRDEPLRDWISEHPEELGRKVRDSFGDQLPFLFKVLSVNKALSIQAHPDKAHAEELHYARPDIYRDPNHKPEMALAITQFEALCGFRPVEEIADFIQAVPELRQVVGEKNAVDLSSVADRRAEVREAVKACFSTMMRQPADVIESSLKALVLRVHEMDEVSRAPVLGDLLVRLNDQFPGDVGCFAIFFLNHVVLQPGEAMFLGPNVPHAYLSGDCMECMACSDNVVRAGLTPKFKDVDTLCEMLTYECRPAKTQRFQGRQESAHVTLFDPPVPDFAVAVIEVPATVVSFSLPPRDSASIVLVLEGQGTLDDLAVGRGSVVFLPARSAAQLSSVSADVMMYQAFSNP